MFEKEAEELFRKKPLGYEMKPELEIYKDGFKDGYNKANEWHYVKDGDLPKETRNYLIYSEEFGVEIKKFFVDVGYFECRKNTNVSAWKEIVLPKESE